MRSSPLGPPRKAGQQDPRREAVGREGAWKLRATLIPSRSQGLEVSRKSSHLEQKKKRQSQAAVTTTLEQGPRKHLSSSLKLRVLTRGRALRKLAFPKSLMCFSWLGLICSHFLHLTQSLIQVVSHSAPVS